MLAYEIHNLLKKLAIPINMWRYRFTIRRLVANYFHLIPMHKQKRLGKKKKPEVRGYLTSGVQMLG